VLEFSHVTKHYDSRTVLDDVTFDVKAGWVTGLVGPNGSGKTTLARILLGLAAADSGSVRIDGLPYTALDRPGHTVGTLFESVGLHPNMTAYRHLRIQALAVDASEKRVADMQPRLDKYEASFRKAARKHFEAQRKAVIDELNEVEDGNRSLAKRDIDPIYKQLALIMSDDQWDINLQDALMPLYTKLMKEQIKDAWAQLPNFKPPKDVPAVSEFVKQRARKIAVDINDESQKQILLTLAEGIDKGESRNELRARVENIFGDMSSKRADRIARTESVRAASQADIYGWDDSDIVTSKEWHTKLGDACPFCQSLNGKIVELNKPFVELGDRLEVTTTSKAGNPVTHTLKVDYEPMVGPPSHPNCRCVLLPVIVDQN